MNDTQRLQPPTGLPRPSPPRTPAGPESTSGRRRGRHRGLIIGGAIILGIVALGIVGLGLDQALTHDLLSADFSASDDTFKTGETDDYTLDIVEGSYRLTSTSSPTSPLMTFGWFARTAYSVEIEASVVRLEAGAATLGLECANSVTDQSNSGYLFLYDPSDGYVLSKVSSGSGAEVLERAPGVAPQAGTRIGISCGKRGLLPDAKTTITGTIDGTAVIRAEDGDYESFEAMSLVFWPTNADDSIRFDDITAIVPGG